MITNKEFVARITNNLKSLNKDQHISRRFILSIGRVKASFLISQKFDEMTMFREEDVLTTIPCLEMVNVPVVSCPIIEFKGCKSIMRSKCKLPKTINGKNGVGVVNVYTVDQQEFFVYVSLKDYAGLKKRKYVYGNQKYFTVIDGYLYLLDSEIEVVSLTLFTMEDWNAEEDCTCNEDGKCKDVWSSSFNCPDRFLDLVAKDTLTEVMSFYRSSIEDSNPNLDVNIKNKDTK
jgi:hypothetical protein